MKEIRVDENTSVYTHTYTHESDVLWIQSYIHPYIQTHIYINIYA